VVLTLLAILIAALTLLAILHDVLPHPATIVANLTLCGMVVIVALASLAIGDGASVLELPIGMGAAAHLALDPLAASFLAVLFLVMPCGGATPPLRLAAVGVILLAGDPLVLIVGVLMLRTQRTMRLAAVAAICLTAALALAGSLGDFAVIRSAPPEGWRAAAVLLLTLSGAAVLSRLEATLAIYVVLRALFDLCGPVQPLWWGVPLLLSGAAISVIGTLRATLTDTLHAVMHNLSLNQFGMTATVLGLALFARAVDLPSTASHALEAAWLAVVCHLLGRTLLLRCADAVESSAGTRRLDRLGGLVHRMPVTATGCLAGLFAVAVLPPGLGFVAFWLLFQSLLAAARSGGFGLELLVVSVAVAVGLSAGLATLAAVRLFGVAFLGVPRSPRCAVAEETNFTARLITGGLAALAALLGVLPVLILLPASRWTHAPALAQLVALRIGVETPGYSPIVLGVLLAAAAAAIRRGPPASAGRSREPAWAGGFAAPPSWLPFGDPATQCGSASFVEPLRRLLRRMPSKPAIRDVAVRLVMRVTR
jgi:hydrogenase-4 component B